MSRVPVTSCVDKQGQVFVICNDGSVWMYQVTGAGGA